MTFQALGLPLLHPLIPSLPNPRPPLLPPPLAPSLPPVMPTLVCSVDTSPIRELTSIYASNPRRGDSTPANPTWRRAFGCSVDCAHVVTALGRIERGCRDAGVPCIPREVWGPAISEQGGKVSKDERREHGEEERNPSISDHKAPTPPPHTPQLTLEKTWAVVTRDPWLRESLACVFEGEP